MITARNLQALDGQGRPTRPARHIPAVGGGSLGIGSRCPAGYLRPGRTSGHACRGSTPRTRPGVDTLSRVGVSLGFLMRGGAVW